MNIFYQKHFIILERLTIETTPICVCPGGRYVMMVSLYDRLGGNILRWSKMKGQHWGGATLPVHHEGGFYNVEMKVCMRV